MFDAITAQFTFIDWLFVGWMGFSLLLGLFRGFISEVLSLIGWIIAFALANHYAAAVGARIPLPVNDATPAYIAGFLAVFIGVLVLWTMVRTLLRFAVGKGIFDYLLGLAFGAIRGFLVSTVAISLLSVLIPLPNQPWWQKAYFRPTLESGAMQMRTLLPAQWGQRLQITADDLPKKEAAPVSSAPTATSDTHAWIGDAPAQIKNLTQALPSSLPSTVDQGLVPLMQRSFNASNPSTANEAKHPPTLVPMPNAAVP